jgi:hypothetical protein
LYKAFIKIWGLDTLENVFINDRNNLKYIEVKIIQKIENKTTNVVNITARTGIWEEAYDLTKFSNELK